MGTKEGNMVTQRESISPLKSYDHLITCPCKVTFTTLVAIKTGREVTLEINFRTQTPESPTSCLLSFFPFSNYNFLFIFPETGDQ